MDQLVTDKNSRVKRAYYFGNMLYYANIVSNRFLRHDITRYKKPIMPEEEGNRALYEFIVSGRPFAVARYGGTEARTIADVLHTSAGGKIGGLRDITLKRIVDLSGFFPKDDKSLLKDFAQLYIDCSRDVDILAVWNVVMQKYFADEIAKRARLADFCMLEPYYFSAPWSRALEGKRVVVIHPFSETIESQYKKREQIFDNKDVLPEFELRTVKAVQTLAGVEDERFRTWFEALDYMYDEVMSRDFDIALIGCGAYGLPLAVRIKRSGKQAVHMGGCLQILFGIKGKRWDDDRFIGKLYNDAWVRPGDNERISNSNVVENGCYW